MWADASAGGLFAKPVNNESVTDSTNRSLSAQPGPIDLHQVHDRDNEYTVMDPLGFFAGDARVGDAIVFNGARNAEVPQIDVLNSVFLNKSFQPFGVLAPVEVRVEQVTMAVFRAARELVEVFDIERVDADRDDKHPAAQHPRRYTQHARAAANLCRDSDGQ